MFDFFFDEVSPDRRDRIREKILSRCVLDPVTGCLEWQGSNSGSGRGGRYGRMCLDGATVATHIAMWVNENGLIPPRKQLDHKCENRICCRLGHLELVTHKENQRRRAAAKLRKERAQHGW